MALTYPDLLPGVFAAGAGNHDEIPDTNADEGRMAWDVGFPSETSQPIVAGGVPPRRLDMNGLGNRLSQHIFFQQSGALYVWSADLDYPAGAHILGSNGVEYIAVAASGPTVTGGSVNPTTDVNFTRWKSYQRSLVDIIYPVGSIYMSVNSVNPGTLFGGTWQAISGRFLLAASSTYPLGTTGGAVNKQLSVNEMPAHTHVASTADAGGHVHTATNANGGAHTHTISVTAGAQSAGAHTHGVTYAATSVSATAASNGAHTHGVTFPKTTIGSTSAGAHTHTRGTMEITGRLAAAGLFDADTGQYEASGALSKYTTSQNKGDADKTGSNTWGLALKASDGWTGATASNGAHTHNVTIAATAMTTASAGAHTHSVSVTVPKQTMTTASAGAHTHNLSGTTASAGSHTHTITVQTAGVHQHGVTVNTAGGNASFNIMPPYIAVNVWKRTA